MYIFNLILFKKKNFFKVSANYFAEGAYKLLSSRQEQTHNYIEMAQRVPKLQYFSDLAPILNSFNSLGQIDMDGVVKVRMLK